MLKITVHDAAAGQANGDHQDLCDQFDAQGVSARPGIKNRTGLDKAAGAVVAHRYSLSWRDDWIRAGGAPREASDAVSG